MQSLHQNFQTKSLLQEIIQQKHVKISYTVVVWAICRKSLIPTIRKSLLNYSKSHFDLKIFLRGKTPNCFMYHFALA